MAPRVLLALLIIIVGTTRAFAQPDVDSILIGNRELPQVLLVGTFHFEYYDLDAHVTDTDKRVNVQDDARQKQVEELVHYVARFKPTAIAVESAPHTGYLLRRYEHYLRTDSIPRANEIDQIGFRLMRRFQLDTLYGVDANTLGWDLYDSKDSLVIRPIMDSIYADWDFTSDDPTSLRYNALFDANDEYNKTHSLLDALKYRNSDKMLDRDYGAYLTGDFKLGTLRGADGLAMHWYARNLRIFRNIQRLELKPTDRLVVIYGAGHMGVLRHLFECSPEFKLVKFGEL